MDPFSGAFAGFPTPGAPKRSLIPQTKPDVPVAFFIGIDDDTNAYIPFVSICHVLVKGRNVTIVTLSGREYSLMAENNKEAEIQREEIITNKMNLMASP